MSTSEPSAPDPWKPPSEWSPEQPSPWGQPPAPPHGYPGPAIPAPPYGPPAQAPRPDWGQPAPWGQPGVSAPPPYGWTPPISAPKPGIVALRPLGVGELLDGALSLIRSNPRTVLGLAAAISSISALIQTLGLLVAFRALGGAAALGTPDPGAPFEDIVATQITAVTAQLVPALMAGFLQVLASGLFIVLVAAAVLGQRLDAGQTWDLMRPRLLALLGLTLLVFVLGAIAIGAAVGCIVGLALLLDVWAILPGILIGFLSLAGVVFCVVRLAVAAPALVIEGLSPIHALRRSWRLVHGSWWRVLGILLLSAIITNLLTAIVTVPITGVAIVISGLEGEFTVATMVAAGLATLIAGVLTLPFSAAVTGLMYTDLRMRREALDIALITSEVAPAEDPLAPYRRVPGL